MASGIHRQVYVISDLHLGGAGPAPGAPGDRGFRIFTHAPELVAFIDGLTAKPVGGPSGSGGADGPRVELVVNGDVVDFLAESDPATGGWTAVKATPQSALRAFDAIAEREKAIFAALARFMRKGHRLTLLLGNHDTELSFPDVRRRLEQVLGYDGRQDFHFLYDGEAYAIGDVLIEHGNRYDPFNVNDYDALRRVRSLMSRRQEVPEEYRFPGPAGSRIVAEVLNPIKVKYPFIDLLKPENETVVPMLLALEPCYVRELGHFARLAALSLRHRMAAPAMPGYHGDVNAMVGAGGAFASPSYPSYDMAGGAAPRPAPAGVVGDIAAAAGEEDGGADSEAALDEALARVMGKEGAAAFRAGLEGIEDVEGTEGGTGGLDVGGMGVAGDISGGLAQGVRRVWGLLELMLPERKPDLDRRLPTLRAALRAVVENQSFDPAVETGTDYREAAAELGRRGFKLIVFGHTHLPKDVQLGDANGARYLNTGTWADIIKFPKELVDDGAGGAGQNEGLGAFVRAIRARDFARWIHFDPRYARLDFTRDASGEERLASAELCSFKSFQSGGPPAAGEG